MTGKFSFVALQMLISLVLVANGRQVVEDKSGRTGPPVLYSGGQVGGQVSLLSYQAG